MFFFMFSVDCIGAEWKYVAPMPNGRYGHDVALGHDGKIYVMGGAVYNYKLIRKYNNGEFSNLVYDPVKNIWKVLEPVPGIINSPDKYNYYDINEKSWIAVKTIKEFPGCYRAFWPKKQIDRIIQIPPEKLRNTNFHRQGDGAAIAVGKDGRIYWTGGKGWWMGHGENIVLPYDPVKMKWPETIRKFVEQTSISCRVKTVHLAGIPPMLERRFDHEAVSLPDGRIFVLGGYHEILKKNRANQLTGAGVTEFLNSIECYDPLKNTWEFKMPMSRRRILFAAVLGRDNKIYIFGGGDKSDKTTGKRLVYNTTEVYDPETDTWGYLAPMPEPRFSVSGALGADGRIYIMGGSQGQRGSPPLKDVFIYDPVADTWEKGPSMQLPRSTLAAVSTPDGKIYAIGGTDAGAYKFKHAINYFLTKDKDKLYDGKVQETVEMLDTAIK